MLWEDLHGLPLDWTDCGSSFQLKMFPLLLASAMMVRMKWELVGAGASPRNRAFPRTTTEPFLEGDERMGSPTPLWEQLERPSTLTLPPHPKRALR